MHARTRLCVRRGRKRGEGQRETPVRPRPYRPVRTSEDNGLGINQKRRDSTLYLLDLLLALVLYVRWMYFVCGLSEAMAIV